MEWAFLIVEGWFSMLIAVAIFGECMRLCVLLIIARGFVTLSVVGLFTMFYCVKYGYI